MRTRRIWIIILLGVLVYVLMSIYASSDDLTSAIGDFRLCFLPALLGLTTANHLLRFIKWDFLLRRVGVRLDIKINMFVYFSGLCMTVTPGKSGEIWKGWLIKEVNGDEISKTVPVVIVERVTDVLGLVLLSLLGLLYYQQSIYFILAVSTVLAGFFVCIRSQKASQLIISILERRASKHAASIRTMHQSFEAAMDPKGLAAMTLLAALGWFLECLGMYLVIQGFGEFISIPLAAFIFSFSSLAGGLSMLPGGLGVAEAGISGFLKLFDFTSALAVGTAIIVRLGTLWYSVILGILIHLIFRRSILGNPK